MDMEVLFLPKFGRFLFLFWGEEGMISSNHFLALLSLLLLELVERRYFTWCPIWSVSFLALFHSSFCSIITWFQMTFFLSSLIPFLVWPSLPLTLCWDFKFGSLYRLDPESGTRFYGFCVSNVSFWLCIYLAACCYFVVCCVLLYLSERLSRDSC